MYALALMGTAHEGRDFAIYMRAAAVAEPVFREYPQHPGAAHYLIHAYDDPIHAPLGLRAARAYSEIAPDAAHAQHMTSHIFVALGMWDDVVYANQNSTRVAERSALARGGRPTRCGHYWFWLEYGHLQRGEHDEAREILEACRDQALALAAQAGKGEPALDPDNSAVGSYTGMRARYLLDTEDWGADVLQWDVPLTSGPRSFAHRLTYRFTDGFAAARRGDLASARDALADVRNAREEMTAYLETLPPTSWGWGPRSQILEGQLEAVIEAAEGQIPAAIARVRDLAKIEEGLPLTFGPPFVDKPSHELLGELLLAAGETEGARKAFRAALDRAPGRRISLEGLAKAERGGG
jgi:tetratricopeptide (TPR) repeat protein